MDDKRSGLLGRLLDAGSRFASAATEQVMSDRRGQEAFARAVGAAQRAKRRLDELQARAMKAAGIPGRQEYQDLVKQLARIKRKARELGEELEAGRPAGGERAAGEEPSDEQGRTR
jgi:hypothetical protein